MTGTIQAICVSEEKGVVKVPVSEADLRTNHGIVGDAHAGDWHRQVSLLAAESIARVKAVIPDLDDGAFAENIVTSGVDLLTATIGDRLHLGEGIVLEVTQIGKECHNACAIKQQTGDCVMPREGIFCRVISGGTLRVGQEILIGK